MSNYIEQKIDDCNSVLINADGRVVARIKRLERHVELGGTNEKWELLTERQKHGLDWPDETPGHEGEHSATVYLSDGTFYSFAEKGRGEDAAKIVEKVQRRLRDALQGKITSVNEPAMAPVLAAEVPKPALKIVAGTDRAPQQGKSFRPVLEAMAKLLKGIEGKAVVCAYGQNPLTGEKLPGVVRHIANDARFTENVLEAINDLALLEHMNVYVFPGLVKLSVAEGQRGVEADVVCHGALVVDFDGQTHTPMTVAGCLPSPSQFRVETSPGNFQCWYVLDKAYPPKETKVVRGLLVAALKPFGADTTQSAEHVFRPAGVPNNPNKKKHDAGRKPSLSRLSTGYLSPEPVTIAQLEKALSTKYGDATPGDQSTVDLTTFDWDEPGIGEHRPIEAEKQNAILSGWYATGLRNEGAFLFVNMCREHGYTREVIDAMQGSKVAERYSSVRVMKDDVARIWAKHKAKDVARAPVGRHKLEAPQNDDEPLELFGDIARPPVLTRDMLPPTIADFAFDTAERIGVDVATVAIAAIATCAAAISGVPPNEETAPSRGRFPIFYS